MLSASNSARLYSYDNDELGLKLILGDELGASLGSALGLFLGVAEGRRSAQNWASNLARLYSYDNDELDLKLTLGDELSALLGSALGLFLNGRAVRWYLCRFETSQCHEYVGRGHCGSHPTHYGIHGGHECCFFCFIVVVAGVTVCPGTVDTGQYPVLLAIATLPGLVVHVPSRLRARRLRHGTLSPTNGGAFGRGSGGTNGKYYCTVRMVFGGRTRGIDGSRRHHQHVCLGRFGVECVRTVGRVQISP